MKVAGRTSLAAVSAKRPSIRIAWLTGELGIAPTDRARSSSSRGRNICPSPEAREPSSWCE